MKMEGWVRVGRISGWYIEGENTREGLLGVGHLGRRPLTELRGQGNGVSSVR